MRKYAKLMLAGGVAGVLGLGAAGLAVAQSGHHGMGRGGGMMMDMMARYDANEDGKLSQEEIDNDRTARHGEFDGDKNTTLSLQEFQALWLKARNEEMVREFQQFDRDGNAQVTLDEYKAPMAAMVKRMDRNGDSMIGEEDRQRGGKRRMMKDGERKDDSQQ